MSDTPITDAAIIERRHIHKRGGFVELLELLDANVSRKLERERNEARNIARWLYQHGMATLKEGAYRRPWVKEAIQ